MEGVERMEEKKCKYCSMMIPQSAKFCPFCRKRLTTSPASIITLLVLVLIVYSCSSMYSNSKAKYAAAAKKAAAAQGASTNQAEPMAPTGPPPSPVNWDYNESTEEMADGKIKTAVAYSENEIEFKFPYQGPQKGTLMLRKHPRYGKDAILQIERGQFLCHSDDCSVNVRFDSGKTLNFSAAEPSDNSSDTLFISNYSRFLNNLKKAKKVYIEAEFFHEGNQVFEFDVAGLKW